MSALCLLVAGVVRASLPGPEFILVWDHSVQKTRWEERYVVEADSLILVEARVGGTGAGMEPPASATFRDGVWTWHPATRLTELRLTQSDFAGDYAICQHSVCRNLSSIVGATENGATVIAHPCG